MTYRKTASTRRVSVGKNTNKKINFALSGFNQQRIVKTGEIEGILSLVPIEHLSGLTLITYTPNQHSVYPYPNKNAKIHGEYQQPTRKIAIYYFENYENLKHTLLHVIGHHVYHSLLPIPQRNIWFKISSQSTKFVSSYSKTNVSEDFAECYAFYVNKPDRLKNDRNRRHFFDNYVFF